MVVFPGCKINLGLHVTAKRNDGFHDLETFFYPLPLRDALEVIEQKPETALINDGVNFSSTGLTIAGDVDKNLCVKAYRLLKKDFPQLPSVQMHLHKIIPMGAGLGGGSADGSFTLKLLNNYFQLGLNDTRLIDYALELGSDCPFFIINKPAFAKGRGELLQKEELSISQHKFVLIHPGIHVNTGWAFSQLIPKTPEVCIKQIINRPITTWKQQLKNDFEIPVFKQYPVLAEIKQKLYDAGAVYASMSGSGSALYGIFEKETDIKLGNLSEKYFYWEEK